MLAIASTFGSYFFSSCSVDYLNNESANKFSSYDEKINFRRKRNVSSSSNDDKININNDHDKILNESDDSHDINKNLDYLEYATQNNNKENIYEEEHIGINNEKEKNIDHHQEVESKDSHDNQNKHEQNYMKSNENTPLPNDHEKSNENTPFPNDHEKSNENTLPYNHMKLDKDEYPNPPIKSLEQDCCSDKSYDECARKKELELNNNKKNYDIYNENAEESNNYSTPYNEKKYRLLGDFSRYMSVTINEKKGGLHNNCTTVLVDVDLFPNVSENYLSKMFDYLTNFKDEEINKNE
ncbi:asparagine-rich antigen, putative [Plasmodium reichenowi]|uniref:Asparagine-rich antigen, putative n=1 Tax=Plasmodium reichenowi TaxID=5854 RepID=A0A060RSW3_PLARE|nr:asparagine-rich antigen, putative [Plasmodium reichenowi]